MYWEQEDCFQSDWSSPLSSFPSQCRPGWRSSVRVEWEGEVGQQGLLSHQPEEGNALRSDQRPSGEDAAENGRTKHVHTHSPTSNSHTTCTCKSCHPEQMVYTKF